MARRRVAVTGLGMICALGRTTAEAWKAVVDGWSGIGPIRDLDVRRLKFQNGAQVTGYDPEQHFDPNRASQLDRFAQFAIVAVREAFQDSGLSLSPEQRERTAVVTGSSLGGQCTQDAGFLDLYRRDQARVHPLSIPRIMASAGASQISMELGVTGPVYTVGTACSAANHAIGQAFCMVRDGTVEAAIAGGSEAPFSFGLLKAWEALRVVSPDTCRPFSKGRRGLILGEGGAMLVLEPLEAALARGARIHAEIVGFGMSSDAHHLTQPSIDGTARTMRAALCDARLLPEQIGYINAHGTGTQMNDAVEARAIRSLFGEHAGRLAISSTKSMHGHTLGAAGAIEAVCTVLALREALLPPTANFVERDADCDLDVVPNRGRPARVEYALSNSFAFGGLNAVLAFRAYAN